MIYRRKLKVPSHIADEMTRIVNEADSSVKGGGVEYCEDVLFDDGRFMTIQVCASENPSEESCWTQGVLYERSGNDPVVAYELTCTDVGDSFLGEYHLDYDGNEYIVEVVKEKKIFKHTVTVTILSEEENLERELGPDEGYWTLENLGAYMTHGEGIGTYELTKTEIVPNDEIEAELFRIGNDGTFFDDF